MIAHRYPAGGWLPEHSQFSWQHPDQGRDFVTNWNNVIQAPGLTECLYNGDDRPFPNGFGPRYAVVRVHTGKFAGHDWYLGHCTSLMAPGATVHFGHPLARVNQGHPSEIGIIVPGNGGWVELGQRQADGTLGPFNSSGHWYDPLLAHPLVTQTKAPDLHVGMSGWAVIGLTANLHACGWFKPKFRWTFDSEVHGAVVAFKEYHHIAMPPISSDPKKQRDRGVVTDAVGVAIKHSADWCKKNHKHENHISEITS